MEDRRTGLLTAVLIAVLLAAAPTPAAAVQLLSAPLDPADPTGPVLAALGVLAWALAGWLTLGAALVVAGRLPGAAGRLAAGAAARALPVAVRRSLEVTLGAALAVGTVGVGPAAAATAEPAPSGAAATQQRPDAAAMSLDWPTIRQRAGTPTPSPESPVATPEPPASAAPSTPNATGPVSPSSQDRAADRATPTIAAGRASVVRPQDAAGTVVVHPGDTLWSLATRELAASDRTPSAAAVAARWPAWWDANRLAIGEDPHLLRPGTELLPPSS